MKKATWILIILATSINILARLSKVFAGMVSKLQVVSLYTLGWFNSMFSFSVGELLIGVFMISAIIAFVMTIILIVKKKSYARTYLRIWFFIVSIIYLQLTINWFVLYHAKSFEEKYLDATLSGRVSELEEYRNRLVEICNELSKEVDRDESGYIIYDGDINAECIKLMKDLGKDYKELSGYYPRPKKVLMSGFMSQQYVSGIYYPFSMEANINGMMYLPNYPATICHELSHLKGIISEDEANFIGYLACIKSNIPFIRYSGYLSVLIYVENEYYSALYKAGVEDRAENIIEILPQVYEDMAFLTKEAWDKVEDSAIVSTEVVSQVSEKVIDNSLKLNGVSDGIVSYSRVVRLLLKYEKEKQI